MTIDAFLKSPRPAQVRRGSVRRKLRLDTVGKAAAKGSTHVEIHDLSTSGMLIETAVELAAGEAIEIELPRTGPQTAKIIWTSGRFYGCRFAEPIPPAAVSAALLRSRPTDQSAAGPTDAPEQASSDFGSRLAELRAAKGLSLQDLADRLEVSRQAVWYWESGQRLPRAEIFQKLAQTLGTSERQLLAPAAPHQGVVASGWDEEFKQSIAERLGVRADQVSIVVTL